jgi:hypothetical protein
MEAMMREVWEDLKAMPLGEKLFCVFAVAVFFVAVWSLFAMMP